MIAVSPKTKSNGGQEAAPARADAGSERLARGLGWFSIGLGLAEVAAPRAVARTVGIGDTDANRNTLVALGVREIATGVAILSRPRAPAWLWARVGGDVLDLAVLGSKFNKGQRNRVTAATAAVLGVMAVDILAGRRLGREAAGQARPGIHVRRAITVNRAPDEIYRFWRDLQNLPQFMDHLESVQALDERRSHWRAKAPAGRTVEWDAEIVDDRPGSLIAWRSLEGADVTNSGSVRFLPAPGDRGTEVHVEFRYEPLGGAIGAAIAKLFGEEPGQQIAGDLRRFKQVLETGEVVHSDASIHRGPHPARPSAAPM